MLGHRQSDFLIGEEPLDGEVGFFAASADADPPAAADPIAETTPGTQAGPLPAGRRPRRGSAVARPRPRARMRQAAAALLFGSCAGLAAIVAFSAPSPPAHRPQPRSAGGQQVQANRGAVSADHRDRSSDAARRGSSELAAARGRSDGRLISPRRQEPPPPAVEPRATPAATAVRTAQMRAPQSIPSNSAPPLGVAQAPPQAEARSEFDFER